MSLLNQVTDSYEDEPGIVTIYGRHGLGKTTLACSYPSPILFNTEKSTPKGVNVPSYKCVKSADLDPFLRELMTENHAYSTLVVDTIDTFEAMLERDVCKEMGWDNISAPGYGIGYDEVATRFGYLMQGLQRLRELKNMHIVILAHAEVTRFDDPRAGSYSVYEIAVRRRMREILSNLSDAIFFMTQEANVKEEKGEKKRASSSGNVWLFTEPSPSYNAKNPWEMPSKVLVPKDDPFSSLAEHIPGLGQSIPQQQEAA